MNNEIPNPKSSNLFEQFLVSRGKINLTEVYNLIFQNFFDDCDFAEMHQESSSVKFVRRFPDGTFEISFKVRFDNSDKPAELFHFPDRRDRNIFYRLMFETGSYSCAVKMPDTFMFYASEKLTSILQKWLRKMSAVSTSVDAEFVTANNQNSSVKVGSNSNETIHRSTALRFVKDFEIGEQDSDGRSLIKIKFADWIRRGFNEEFLDQGIMPLLNQEKIFGDNDVSIYRAKELV